ncbi:MAG: CNP1-like family protein [Neisseria sp.]|uniref:CNP1-like family protein n=1 Tax=Neisseria sp. TaxID=192066 RepID=UPI0026DD2925|nr:CNP1-like family protein [Neisseria sp.]MDO4249270.1 CNP1-like family protein [Neisseria sp.]
MRRLYLLPLFLLAGYAAAENSRTQKDTLVNTRYIERNGSEADKVFKEAEVPLPALPDASANWFSLYVNRDFPQRALIDLDSIALAPDGTIRYTLNLQSASGMDNLTTEALYCASTSFSMSDKEKRSSYKVYGYGDTVNKRWVKPRNPQWQPIGAVLNNSDPVRTVLYRSFCEDGTPESREKLVERLKERATARSKWTK